jgi:hypothetical protein
VKKKTVEKPPRNSAGFCGGGQGLSWAVETRKEGKNTIYVSILKMRIKLMPVFLHKALAILIQVLAA